MLDCVKNFFLTSCAYWFAFILIMFGIIISSVSMRMDQLNTIRNFVISERIKEEILRFFSVTLQIFILLLQKYSQYIHSEKVVFS